MDEQVEDFIWVRCRSAEDALAKWLGRSEPLKCLRVCIADDLEKLRSNSGQLVLGRDSEEGRECVEIRRFVPLRVTADRDGWSTEQFIGMGEG